MFSIFFSLDSASLGSKQQEAEHLLGIFEAERYGTFLLHYQACLTLAACLVNLKTVLQLC